jgi:hypothetical protein
MIYAHEDSRPMKNCAKSIYFITKILKNEALISKSNIFYHQMDLTSEMVRNDLKDFRSIRQSVPINI